MGRGDDAEFGPTATGGPGRRTAAQDRHWATGLRDSVRCSAMLLALLLLVDCCAGAFTLWHGLLWAALSALLFTVLCPPLVRAGEGWLASRGLLGEHRVRTDLLVSVHCLDGVAQRLVLLDACGGRVEIDPRVLVDNPGLWHRLDQGVRRSAADGWLTCGTPELRRVAERIDRETALAVFRLSNLD